MLIINKRFFFFGFFASNDHIKITKIHIKGEKTAPNIFEAMKKIVSMLAK